MATIYENFCSGPLLEKILGAPLSVFNFNLSSSGGVRAPVDQLRSWANAAAVQADKHKRQWTIETEKHTWVAVLTKTDAGVTLILNFSSFFSSFT